MSSALHSSSDDALLSECDTDRPVHGELSCRGSNPEEQNTPADQEGTEDRPIGIESTS